jgi:hypothetical protein
LTFILHASCTPECVDEFEFLNRLISISEAQDILILISSVKAENRAARGFWSEFTGLIRGPNEIGILLTIPS